MKKQVKFDRHYTNIARVTEDKWYDVISEWELGYRLKDDKGTEDDFPKVWVKEERMI